jgi:F0F1-type ATP synthase assembly protein I
MSEPLSESTAWGIYADALELAASALVVAVAVGAFVGLMLGLLTERWVGFAVAGVVGPLAAALMLLEKSRAMRANAVKS